MITFNKHFICPTHVLLQTGSNPPSDPRCWLFSGFNDSDDVWERLYKETNVPVWEEPKQIIVGAIETQPKFYSQFKFMFDNPCTLSDTLISLLFSLFIILSHKNLGIVKEK